MRPTMTFVKDHWESYEVPELAVYLMHDATGAPFLLLNGPEPDHLWEGFTSAVRALSLSLKVQLAVGFSRHPDGAYRTPGRCARSPRTRPVPS